MLVFHQKFFPEFCGKIFNLSTVILKSSQSLWNGKKNFSSRNSGNTFAWQLYNVMFLVWGQLAITAVVQVAVVLETIFLHARVTGVSFDRVTLFIDVYMHFWWLTFKTLLLHFYMHCISTLFFNICKKLSPFFLVFLSETFISLHVINNCNVLEKNLWLTVEQRKV